MVAEKTAKNFRGPLFAAPCSVIQQGCGLGGFLHVLTSRLGLVSDKIFNVSVSSRSRTCNRKSTTELRSVTCHMGSRNVSCHR